MSADGEPLRWFAVAGDNKKFFWAKAIIRNNQVIISCKDVPDPMYIRYAWADNPDHVNFYNNEGLPATPFQAEVATLHTRWHGKKAAVVLTYDDALGVQLDNVIPLLDSLGLKATFYLSAASPGCKDRMNEWKRAAGNGHELGNHTWYHPCDGSKPGRSWVSPANDLSHYTTTQIVREIEMTNEFLQSLDGQRERTFAYTCGDMQTSEGSFVGAIRNQFIAMRGVNGALNKLESLDLTNVNCYVADESNADQFIAWADKAREEHALLVVLFHGVGGGHNINVDLKKHHALLKYLSAHPHDFWVTTMLDAAQHCIEMKNLVK
jgi:sialate O-acetylesterase